MLQSRCWLFSGGFAKHCHSAFRFFSTEDAASACHATKTTAVLGFATWSRSLRGRFPIHPHVSRFGSRVVEQSSACASPSQSRRREAELYLRASRGKSYRRTTLCVPCPRATAPSQSFSTQGSCSEERPAEFPLEI